MHAHPGNPAPFDSAESAGRGAALRAAAWLLAAAALAATFWLYTRPNLLLDLGAILAMCG
jgi:hypothetical protein